MKFARHGASLLGNQNLILLAGFALGLLFGEWAEPVQWLVVPTLVLIMAVATTQVPSRAILDLPRLVRPMSVAVLLSYGLLSPVLLLLAKALALPQDLWIGFVILAAVPPAVAVIPYTELVKGDTRLALIGTVGAYLAALLLSPAVAWLLLGAGVFNPFDLLLVLAELIILPLALSRLLRRVGSAVHSGSWRVHAINWLYFVFFFIVVGVNRQVFLRELDVLALTVTVGCVSMFGLGYALERGSQLLGVGRGKATALTLLGTLKNTGMASAVALQLFGARAAVPAAVLTALIVPYYIWFAFRAKRRLSPTQPPAGADRA